MEKYVKLTKKERRDEFKINMLAWATIAIFIWGIISLSIFMLSFSDNLWETIGFVFSIISIVFTFIVILAYLSTPKYKKIK